MGQFKKKFTKVELRAFFHREDENFNIIFNIDRELSDNDIVKLILDKISEENYNKPEYVIISQFYIDEEKQTKVYKKAVMLNNSRLNMLWNLYLRRRQKKLLEKKL